MLVRWRRWRYPQWPGGSRIAGVRESPTWRESGRLSLCLGEALVEAAGQNPGNVLHRDFGSVGQFEVTVEEPLEDVVGDHAHEPEDEDRHRSCL